MNKKAKKGRQWQHTHETIIQKTIELAKKYGWEKVRVTKLVELANINRNSFYLHFETINDVFDEIERNFVVKYHKLINKASLKIMLEDENFFNSFCDLLESEKENVAVIKKIGRGDHLLFKLQKVWMDTFNTAFSESNNFSKEKNIVLSYISGNMYTFFYNWINDPYGFDIQENSSFNGKVIDHLIKFASKEN